MDISRGLLLARLEEAAIAVSPKAVLEQSECFVFTGDKLITFNDEIMVRTQNPLGFDVVVNAADLKETLAKLPDDEISVTFGGGELRVKGKRRTAGLTATAEATLPISEVPAPDKWARLEEGVLSSLLQAARVCGNGNAQYLATVVHITPNLVEGCDNSRLYRVTGATGFPGPVLIPARSVAALDKMELTKVCIGKGWVHFKTAGGAEISVVCSNEKYHPNIDKLLEMNEAEKITLPANLGEIIERAEVFNSGAYDDRVGVKIQTGEIVITSRKEGGESGGGGWYRERKKIGYTGRLLNFNINPKFLVEVLKKNRDVAVNDRKLKLVSGPVQFVVCLEANVGKDEE